MKIITIEFEFPSGRRAKAVGYFKYLPGDGPVKWSGDKELVEEGVKWCDPPDPEFKLEDTGFAEDFEDSMVYLGEQCGAKTTVTSQGEWKAFER